MRYTLNDILSKLRIVPTSSLVQHEERIERNIMLLKEAMLNIGQLVDPLIVDKKTNIVLDGNHRMKVLELIKVPQVVCQIVDYDNPDILVGGWYPSAKNIPINKFEKFKIEPVDLGTGRTAIDKMKAVFMLVNNEGNYLIEPGSYDVNSLIDTQQNILKSLDEELNYVEDTLLDSQETNSNGFGTSIHLDLLVRKNYTKKEIIERSLSGRHFPPKSTRHIIPDRIIRLNMRLGWLHQDKDEAWKYLRRLLKNRVYGGNVRRYTEPVIVIY